MTIEGVTQALSVTSGGTPTAGAAGNLNAVTVDAGVLEDLPVLDQDVVGPVSRFLDSSAIGTSGATLLVGGIEVSALRVPPSAIQQVKINQDPYAAEFMRPGRGRIEIVTLPGSREYTGSFHFRFRDSDLNARNAFATSKPPEQRRGLEGTFGGPVPGTSRTNFVLSGSRRAEDSQEILFAQTLTGPVVGSVRVRARHRQPDGDSRRRRHFL